MSQEIEIEFKNLLTKEEFDRLLYNLPFPEYSETQTNFYFETKNFSLRENGCALRIREKNGKFQLTLKEPHSQGLLETHDVLTKQEAQNWMEGNIQEKEHTAKQLEAKGISPQNLIYYGSLTTERREVDYQDVLLILDYSTYHGQEDYELELEASSRTIGEDVFNRLLEKYQIPKRKTPNKIKRFFSGMSD
ncbi:adenylate cyclase [Virgibacillus indicus]|uniref:Adenylate cyclase n=1 Tax=Virgibacillus indicus TaxID=2024554 RepID=A0A265NFQ8_9BACI|nr:CYTH domain-containing protein [Virgibacillus indicus]OZU90615.1 adenylate cyclase [Virgibacillus indicus]